MTFWKAMEKGKILFRETCDMLANISNKRSVSSAKSICDDKHLEEMQYAIIISRLYYAFMLIAKAEMVRDGLSGEFEHKEMMEYGNACFPNTLRAFRTLRNLRNDSDYKLEFLDLKRKWENFKRLHYSTLVKRYQPIS